MDEFIAPDRAAALLGISAKHVHNLTRRLLLEPHYPYGPKAGKHFREEDVLALAELRAQESSGLKQRLPQLAMRAIIASKRTERRLEELLTYLGLQGETLPTEEKDILRLHLEAEEFVRQPAVVDDDLAMKWATKLRAVTEEYLELAARVTGQPEPWQVYLEAGRAAAKITSTATSRAYVDHARVALRHVIYFHERAARGVRAASRIFPNERFSGRLLQRLMPI